MIPQGYAMQPGIQPGMQLGMQPGMQLGMQAGVQYQAMKMLQKPFTEFRIESVPYRILNRNPYRTVHQLP